MPQLRQAHDGYSRYACRAGFRAAHLRMRQLRKRNSDNGEFRMVGPPQLGSPRLRPRGAEALRQPMTRLQGASNKHSDCNDLNDQVRSGGRLRYLAVCGAGCRPGISASARRIPERQPGRHLWQAGLVPSVGGSICWKIVGGEIPAHSDEVGRRFRAKPAACTD